VSEAAASSAAALTRCFIFAPGDVVAITIANQQNNYKQLIQQVVLNPGTDIFAGLLTEQDVYTYDILAITPADGTTPWYQQSPQSSVFCTIMLPDAMNAGY
jgi:hypothetical protein